MLLNREQVANGEYENFNPLTHDFRWNQGFTEVEVIRIEWHDDASYAAYQGDNGICPECRRKLREAELHDHQRD